jgi:lysozyme
MNIQKLKDQLTIDENRKKKPYTDTVGKISIGVGRNLTDNGLSDSEIDMLLSNDIDDVISQLNVSLPWWTQMTDARQRVIANMTFNMGMDKVLEFKNTLAFMRTGQYDKAADGMLQSLWARQVGDRAKRLADMMRAG